MFALRPLSLPGRLLLAFATLIALLLALALTGWLAGQASYPRIAAHAAEMHRAIVALGLLGAGAGLVFAHILLRGLRQQQQLLDDELHLAEHPAEHPPGHPVDRPGRRGDRLAMAGAGAGAAADDAPPAAAPRHFSYIVARPPAAGGASAAPVPAGAKPPGATRQPADPAGDLELARLQQAVAQLQVSLREVVRGVRDKAASGQSGARPVTAADPTPSHGPAAGGTGPAGTRRSHHAINSGPSLMVDHAVDVAQRSAEVVSQVVDNLDEITAASRRIADTVGVIDAITFQTSLLALNATVEAARAGEQGSAASAAAADVRMLAQRAATASREIRGLIAGTLSRLEGDARGLGDKGHTMAAIVGSVQCVTDIVGHLSQAPGAAVPDRGKFEGSAADAAAGTAAAGAAGQLGAAQLSVAQLEQMTRQNTQLVQQSSSAAESLRLQAERLQKVVAAFRLLQQTQQAAWAAHSAITDARRSARLGGSPFAAGAPGAAPPSRPDTQDGG
ncbi:MAG: hypothetical protein RLZZ584_3533 [Pseudomonadota bacterium]